MSGVLLRILFGGTFRAAHELGFAGMIERLQSGLHGKSLAVFRTALFYQHIGWLRPSNRLQFFLQRGLVIGHRQAAAIRSNAVQLRSDDVLQHETPRRLEPAIQIDAGEYRLQRVYQESSLIAASALLFAAPQAQIVSEF